MYIKGTVEERFHPRVQKAGAGECWEWDGYRSKKGYGVFCATPGKVYQAHRLAWQFANAREIPAGMLVLHSCDNPPCCNPAHLRVGTVKDNAQDALQRGRAFPGRVTVCKHGHAFTPENTRHARPIGNGRIRRVCIACQRERGRVRYHRIAAQQRAAATDSELSTVYDGPSAGDVGERQAEIQRWRA